MKHTAEKTIYTLLDVSKMISSALLDLSQTQFWVKGQVSSGRANANGHWYGELVGVDDQGATCAKIKAMIWKGRFLAIQKKLKEAGAEEAMKGNKEICVLCSVSYHHSYGLSLQITDVDPSYGEAQIAKNRRMIIETLFKEGVLRKNGEVKVPVPPQRIGLVTSKGSAAEQDFVRTLDSSPYAFRIYLAHASVQGENTALEVITAMRRLVARGVDVICIIRGGGSQTDLAWFDHMDIARVIVNCPVPVFVGIGHEIDRGALDEVAHTSFKTPTAVGEHLVATMKGLQDYLESAKDRLGNSIGRILDIKKKGMDAYQRGFVNGFRKLYELHSSRFRERGLTAGNAFSGKLHAFERELEGKLAKLKERATAYLNTREARVGESDKAATLARFFQIITAKTRLLDEKLRLIESLGTEKVLRRGFTLTKDGQGRVITSAKQVAKGQKMTTEFKDGHVESVASGIV